MRQLTSQYILVVVAMVLLQGTTALKPSMSPSKEELLIQEGDELKIACKGEGKIQFSTQKNMAHVNQSEYHISFDIESGWYTFTRPNTTRADTGWYACAEEGIEIQNDEQTIDHPETDISWIYVYVNSSELFAIEYRDVIKSPYIFVPMMEGRTVIVPCRPTSPDLPVTLEINGGAIPVPKNTTYDSKIGFIMTEHPSHESGDVDMGALCQIDLSKQPENQWLPKDYGFSAYELLIVDEFYASPPNVEWVVRGENLTLEYWADTPTMGGRVLLYWDIPKSIPAGRVKYENKSDDPNDSNSVIRTTTLEINYVEKSDSGPYRYGWMDLSNDLVRSKTTHVWVSERDEVPKGDSKRVNTNQNAFLSCEAGWFGGSGDDYVWTKIGDSEYTKPMVPDPDHWLNDDKFTLGYLFFYNVSRGDNGTYECRLSNISGTVVDQKYLIVDGVPEVKIGFTKAVAFHGDTRLITLNDSALNLTNISWIVVGILVILFLVMATWMQMRKRSEMAPKWRFPKNESVYTKLVDGFRKDNPKYATDGEDVQLSSDDELLGSGAFEPTIA